MPDAPPDAVRHAKSDWTAPGARDHERPLSARGREAAPKMGAYMARHALVPDLILASTAARVAETLKLVAPAFAKAPKVVEDARLYEAEADELLGSSRRRRRRCTACCWSGTILALRSSPRC